MAEILGHWQLDRHENMEEYMKAVGVKIPAMKGGQPPAIFEEIKRDGELWEIQFTSPFKNAHLKFKLEEEFEEETMGGKKVKSTFTLEGEKLIHRQVALAKGDENCEITREVGGETLVVTLEALNSGVTAKRFCKRKE